MADKETKQRESPFAAAKAAEEQFRKEQMKMAAAAAPDVPFSTRTHPDGTAKYMLVSRPNGAGEREITAEQWETDPLFTRAQPGGWVIRMTEVVAPHHSDGIV